MFWLCLSLLWTVTLASKQRQHLTISPSGRMTISTEPSESVKETAQNKSPELVLPAWATDEPRAAGWGEQLIVPEWEDKDNFRANNGWRGRDLIHDVNAAVRVLHYFANYGNGQGIEGFSQGGVGTTLTGIVHFTHRAESHAGFSHGGSMTSVLDDVVGWCGFLATGTCRPWSGFTVQINTALKKPIRTGSVLLVQAKITRIERRKVFIEAALVEPNPGGEDVYHAKGDGLVVLNKGVLPLEPSESFNSIPSM